MTAEKRGPSSIGGRREWCVTRVDALGLNVTNADGDVGGGLREHGDGSHGPERDVWPLWIRSSTSFCVRATCPDLVCW